MIDDIMLHNKALEKLDKNKKGICKIFALPVGKLISIDYKEESIIIKEQSYNPAPKYVAYTKNYTGNTGGGYKVPDINDQYPHLVVEAPSSIKQLTHDPKTAPFKKGDYLYSEQWEFIKGSKPKLNCTRSGKIGSIRWYTKIRIRGTQKLVFKEK